MDSTPNNLFSQKKKKNNSSQSARLVFCSPFKKAKIVDYISTNILLIENGYLKRFMELLAIDLFDVDRPFVQSSFFAPYELAWIFGHWDNLEIIIDKDLNSFFDVGQPYILSEMRDFCFILSRCSPLFDVPINRKYAQGSLLFNVEFQAYIQFALSDIYSVPTTQISDWTFELGHSIRMVDVFQMMSVPGFYQRVKDNIRILIGETGVGFYFKDMCVKSDFVIKQGENLGECILVIGDEQYLICGSLVPFDPLLLCGNYDPDLKRDFMLEYAKTKQEYIPAPSYTIVSDVIYDGISGGNRFRTHTMCADVEPGNHTLGIDRKYMLNGSPMIQKEYYVRCDVHSAGSYLKLNKNKMMKDGSNSIYMSCVRRYSQGVHMESDAVMKVTITSTFIVGRDSNVIKGKGKGNKKIQNKREFIGKELPKQVEKEIKPRSSKYEPEKKEKKNKKNNNNSKRPSKVKGIVNFNRSLQSHFKFASMDLNVMSGSNDVKKVLTFNRSLYSHFKFIPECSPGIMKCDFGTSF